MKRNIEPVIVNDPPELVEVHLVARNVTEQALPTNGARGNEVGPVAE
jgi:hypothetical protein